MLQYHTQPTDRYSVPEQCQMVIEGGCAWIQLHTDVDEGDVRDLASELIPLCRETSTILMLENRPDLAKELGLHGVHITLGSGLNARQIREDFGPEAIIGVEVSDAASILALKGADIDYVTLPSSLSAKKRIQIVTEARDAGNEMPVVFAGDFDIEDISAVMADGADGICTGRSIMESTDPSEYTDRMISALLKAKGPSPSSH